MTVTGRPWDELEETLTWPRIQALSSYWNDHPPVHELVAAMLGVNPGNKEKASLGELISMFEGGVVK
jgi:hypothetical protein